MKKYAVLGDPISHSLSPLIHTSAYPVLGLDWQYQAVRLPAADFAAFLAGAAADFAGFSVTMPLKHLAAQTAVRSCKITAALGIANTLVRQPCGDFMAHNTDVPALVHLFSNTAYELNRVHVLGAGATALSAGVAAALAGASAVVFYARREQAALGAVAALQRVLTAFGLPQHVHVQGAAFETVDLASTPSFTVSTLPGAAEVQLPQTLIQGTLFDVAYSPAPSAVGASWLQSAIVPGAGLQMLKRQALLQLRIFVAGDIHTPLPCEAQVVAAIAEAVNVAQKTA